MIASMFESMGSSEVVDSIRHSMCEESMLMAARMAAVGELLARRIAEVEVEDPDLGYMLVTGYARTSVEVAAAAASAATRGQ